MITIPIINSRNVVRICSWQLHKFRHRSLDTKAKVSRLITFSVFGFARSLHYRGIRIRRYLDTFKSFQIHDETGKSWFRIHVLCVNGKTIRIRHKSGNICSGVNVVLCRVYTRHTLVPEVFSRSGAPKANEQWGEFRLFPLYVNTRHYLPPS